MPFYKLESEVSAMRVYYIETRAKRTSLLRQNFVVMPRLCCSKVQFSVFTQKINEAIQPHLL